MKPRHQTLAEFDRISTSIDTFQDSIPDEVAQHRLIQMLSVKLLPFVHFSSYFDPYTLSTHTTASVNVATTGIQHAQIEAEGFRLNGQVFDSSQISQALLHTYPERFI